MCGLNITAGPHRSYVRAFPAIVIGYFSDGFGERLAVLMISRLAALQETAIGRHRLDGLWTYTKVGFYHDGRFPTLLDVVYE